MSFFKYFASAKGRNVTFYASVAASIGAFSINFFPDTFLLWKHRDIVAAYKDGEKREVSDTIKKRFEFAVELLKVPDFERKHIKPFVVTGFDLYHIGSTKFRFGGLLGIPVNYTYTAPADISKSSITIRGQPIDWNSHGGKLLEQSLVLSDDEQVFGILREILQLWNNSVYLNSSYSTGSVVAYYIATNTLNSKLRLFSRPLSLRVVMYGIVGFFMYGVYSFLTDFTQVKYDKGTDETLAALGRTYIEAGIRFYDKILKKNIACRELTGDESEYTALGNENFLFRQKRVPLTSRKAFFEEKLKELDEQEKNPVESPKESPEKSNTEESVKK